VTSAHPAERPGLAQVLAAELDRLRAEGLYRERSRREGKQGVRIEIGGRQYLSFASNDYLGLAADSRLSEVAADAARRFGVGAGASHLLHGHASIHAELEEALAAFVGYPQALAFSSGYRANLAVVTALCGRDDEIFADKLNHASLNDAMVLSRARFSRYPHLDLDRLDRALQASRARRKLVITDAVFSMDGDLAPVPMLLEICERRDAVLFVDDAHGFGVLGPHGAGTVAHFGVRSERLVYMATLGKAAGVYGAFVAAHPPLIEYLVNRARTYIYTTAAPPLLAATALESLAILRSEDWRRERLAQSIRMLANGLTDAPGRLLRSSTAIQPLLLGDASEATRVSERLAAQGLIAPPVRPPTVPRGSARLRISLSAAHSPDDIERLLAALRQPPP
jgi:8-amino-7-oxononanoate synthase